MPTTPAARLAMRIRLYITTGILTTSKGKFRCTLSDRKHYLIAGPHRARKIGHDRLRVIVPLKKYENERWTFKIISEEEVGKLVHDSVEYFKPNIAV